MTTSQSAKILGEVDVLSSRQHVRHVLGRRPADLDPAHDDFLARWHAVREPSVVDVDHRRAEFPSGRAPRRCPRPSGPRPSTPTRFTGLGCDRRVAHARVAREPVLHEEDARSGCRDRRADAARRNAFCSTFSPSSSGRLQPSRIALSATSGAGYCPLVLPLMTPSATAKANVELVVVQAPAAARELLAPFLPLAALLQVLDQPRALPRPADRRGRRRRPGRARRPSAPRRSRPSRSSRSPAFRPISAAAAGCRPSPGIRPTLTSGRPICVCGAVETSRSSIDSASSVPPPMQAPSIRATVGNGRRLIRLKSWWPDVEQPGRPARPSRSSSRRARSGRPRRRTGPACRC